MNRWLTLTLLIAVAEVGVANDSAWPPGNSAAETSPGKATSAPRAVAGPDLASAKLRSFNQDDYDLAFTAFMGSGDLKRAYLLASKAVQSVPTDVTWRQRLASVAEWVGNPLVAWENWAYLFQQGARSDEVINGVVRLAPYVGQPDVAIEAWEYRAAHTTLSDAQWADIRFLYETVGKPQQGRRFFEAQYRKRHDGRLLEHAAALAENAGEDERALQLYLERVRLKPFTTEATLRAALLLLRREREREAYALLLAHSRDVPEDAEEFWRLLGNTAWELMENDAAEMAYRRYAPSPSATSGDWSRLIYLVRQRHSGAAAELSFEAYRRYGNIENLLQALGIYAEIGDAKGEARLYQQLKVQELEGLEQDARFLVLRAQHFQRVAEPEKSWGDYRRALAINPFDPQVATPALWFLIDTGRRKELEALLGVLRASAHKDAAYWLPFAAANLVLDLDVHSRQMEARLALGVGRQLLLGWAENSQASAEPVLTSYVPTSERLTSLGMRWQREQGATQVHVFQRDERDRNTGLRFAQTWFWGRRLALDGTLGWRADSSDSLPLRVAGSEDHVQLGFNYALSRREYVRMTARVARYQTQSGDSLGTGRVHEFEVGHRVRTEYPDFRVRLFGMQQSYAYDDSLGDRTRDLSPAVRAAVAAGTVDPMKYFLPQGSTTWGACLGLGENRAGQSVQEVYSRAFKPFFETCATSNSLNGGGYAGVLGIAGTVTGEDHLSLRIEQSSGGAGTGALTRVLALRYRHYF